VRRPGRVAAALAAACVLLVSLASCSSRASLPRPTAPFTRTPDADFRGRAPEPWPAPPARDDSGLQLLRLPNGLEVYYVERPQTPIVSLAYVSRAARELEAGVPPGLATLTGRALVASTSGPNGEVLLGIRVGGVSPSVSVSKSGTVIALEVFSSGWRTALQTLARVVQQPAFDPREVASLRDELFEEAVDSEFSYDGVVLPLAVRALLGEGDPWAVGARERAEAVRAFMRQDLVDYYLGKYRPSLGALIVVGDAPAAEVRELAREHFGAWEPRAPGATRGVRSLSLAQKKIAASDRRRVLALLAGGDQALVLLPQRAAPPNHPDRVALELLAQILAGGYQSRAQLALRHSGGLTYGVAASLDGSSERAFLLVSAQVEAAAIREGVSKLEREIERLRAEPVSESELAAARSAYLGGGGGATNEGIAAAIASLYLDGRGGDDVPDFAALADAVQPADLLRVAREYLNPSADLVVVGDVFESRKQLEALGDVKYLAVTK
jgi:zinc protease